MVIMPMEMITLMVNTVNGANTVHVGARSSPTTVMIVNANPVNVPEMVIITQIVHRIVQENTQVAVPRIPA